MENFTGVVGAFALFYMCFALIGMIVLIDVISKAFEKGILEGLWCAFIPVGTYYYCKGHWQDIKIQGISLIVCSIGAVVFKLLELALK